MARKWKNSNMNGSNPAGPVYFFGFIGAFVYFLHISYGFWPSVVAFLKALVWPAYLVYHLFGL